MLEVFLERTREGLFELPPPSAWYEECEPELDLEHRDSRRPHGRPSSHPTTLGSGSRCISAETTFVSSTITT